MADEVTIDRLLGFPPAEAGGITVETSTYLRGNLAARGSSALDGDPDTSWRTQFGAGNQDEASIDVTVPAPLTVDHLDLVLLADGVHSVPTRLRIEGDGESRTVDVPEVADGEAGATARVTVRFDPITTD